jgi:hypothetical protein
MVGRSAMAVALGLARSGRVADTGIKLGLSGITKPQSMMIIE